MGSYQQAAPTGRTEEMLALFVSPEIACAHSIISREGPRSLLPQKFHTFHLSLTLFENDIFALGINIEVPILGADGAIAAHNLHGLERGKSESILDSAAVAIGFIQNLFGLVGGCGRCHDG